MHSIKRTKKNELKTHIYIYIPQTKRSVDLSLNYNNHKKIIIMLLKHKKKFLFFFCKGKSSAYYYYYYYDFINKLGFFFILYSFIKQKREYLDTRSHCMNEFFFQHTRVLFCCCCFFFKNR